MRCGCRLGCGLFSLHITHVYNDAENSLFLFLRLYLGLFCVNGLLDVQSYVFLTGLDSSLLDIQRFGISLQFTC